MGRRLAWAGVALVLVIGGGVAGRLTLTPALEKARASATNKAHALEASTAELDAKADRLTAVSAESEATTKVAADLYAQNQTLERQVKTLKGQLPEAQRPAPPPAPTASAPCRQLSVDSFLSQKLRRSSDDINPATSLNPPDMDPFGSYAVGIATARRLLDQAADALDRYDVACNGP